MPAIHPITSAQIPRTLMIKTYTVKTLVTLASEGRHIDSQLIAEASPTSLLSQWDPGSVRDFQRLQNDWERLTTSVPHMHVHWNTHVHTYNAPHMAKCSSLMLQIGSAFEWHRLYFRFLLGWVWSEPLWDGNLKYQTFKPKPSITHANIKTVSSLLWCADGKGVPIE